MRTSVPPERRVDDIEPPPPVPTSDPTTSSMLKPTCSSNLIGVAAPSPMVPSQSMNNVDMAIRKPSVTAPPVACPTPTGIYIRNVLLKPSTDSMVSVDKIADAFHNSSRKNTIHLTIELWTNEGLSTVASDIGKPLYPDAITRACTRLDFDRVCVMPDINSKLPKYIVILVPKEDGSETACKVDVEYVWLPPKCNSCIRLGHAMKACPFAKSPKLGVSVYVERSEGMKPKPNSAEVHVERVDNQESLAQDQPVATNDAPSARMDERDAGDHCGTIDGEPWLVGGDFNAVLDMSEVCGTSGDIRVGMDDFQDCINQTGLIDLPMKCERFTYHNCSTDHRSLWKRLDRILVFLKAIKLEQVMLQQRAKIQWMKGGDQCSKVFFRKHCVCGLLSKAVGWDENESSTRPAIPTPLAKHIITEEEGHTLIQPITTEEVKLTVFDIAKYKALGSDGYSSGFYKAAWSIVGDEVQSPNLVADFRPISCCNVLYKVITKILVQRISGVLDKLISPSQNTFVPRRSIGDNILLAQELFSGYNKARLLPQCALKVDLRKAYDTVEWDYFLATLKMFGFPKLFTHWIEEGLQLFASLLVLHANLQKSQLILSKAAHPIQDTLLILLGFQEGHLSVRKLTGAFRAGMVFDYHLAERVQLIKLVLMVLEMYWAMAFILPKGIIKEIEKRLRTFLWKGSSSSGYPKVAWEQVVIKRKRHSIWVDWIIHTRLWDKSIWTITERTGSWGWRKLLKLRTVLLSNIQYCVGDGGQFSLWHDPWHDLGPLILHFPWGPQLTGISPSTTLSGVIEYGGWRWPLITDIAYLEIVHLLPPIHNGMDGGLFSNLSAIISFALQSPSFSQHCMVRIRERVKFLLPHTGWQRGIEWASSRWRGNHVVNAAYKALLASLVYYIWQERNRCRFQNTSRSPFVVGSIVINEITQRILSDTLCPSVSTHALYRL
ncbi:UNVERIFIED_CONTAM: hypothetical protein Slati_1123600 [Sesamum latifolium]|uniref:Reverse transcriptase domain-containing protein n=1 Tax=Sesamum latifolium TaxID=2727402 RepID=A0AAW2XHU7_9LAMI